MRRRLLTIGAVSALALSTVAVLGAQRPGGPGPGREGRRGPAVTNGQPRGGGPGGQVGRGRAGGGAPFVGGLDLTEDQRGKISDVMRKTQDDAGPLVDQLALAKKTLHREVFADKRDNGKIASLSNDIAKLEKQVADLHLKAETVVADLLTPEQRETVRARGVGRGGPRGPAGFGGPGGPHGARGRTERGD